MTVPWRVFIALREIPVLGRFAMLAVELEAAGLALCELRACGILQGRDVVEAGVGLASYGYALFSRSAED